MQENTVKSNNIALPWWFRHVGLFRKGVDFVQGAGSDELVDIMTIS
jgi:hypothetical protein